MSHGDGTWCAKCQKEHTRYEICPKAVADLLGADARLTSSRMTIPRQGYCPKCGGEDFVLLFMQKKCTDPDCKQSCPPDHISVNCKRCHYAWNEPPLNPGEPRWT